MQVFKNRTDFFPALFTTTTMPYNLRQAKGKLAKNPKAGRRTGSYATTSTVTKKGSNNHSLWRSLEKAGEHYLLNKGEDYLRKFI